MTSKRSLGRREWIRAAAGSAAAIAVGCGSNAAGPDGGFDAGGAPPRDASPGDSGLDSSADAAADGSEPDGGADGGPPGQPSFVFIMVDDLNDFPSPFGGYQGQVHTPNFERLAAMGVTFQNAYCAVPVCGGSRLSILSGMAPYRTGRYGNEDSLSLGADDFPPGLFARLRWLPQALRGSLIPGPADYRVHMAGKIFHNSGLFGFECAGDARTFDPETCETTYSGYAEACSAREFGQGLFADTFATPDLRVADSPYFYAQAQSSMECWSQPAYDGLEDQLPDRQVATFGAEVLRDTPPGERFFAALGFYRPHGPWHVPSRFYAMYPEAGVVVPSYLRESADRDDLSVLGCLSMRWQRLAGSAGLEGEDWERAARAAIRGYLASVSYVDEQLGLVLDAVERRRESGERVVVVLASDHGWFLGEKLGWQKQKLYEPAARAPLIISDPAGAQGQSCHRIVSLLDLYPTVLAMAGISPASPLDGVDLQPLLQNPDSAWDRSAITAFCYRSRASLSTVQGSDCADGDPTTADDDVRETGLPYPEPRPDAPSNGLSFSIRNERYRFHSYAGSEVYERISDGLPPPHEELYDLSEDPEERRNLLHPPVRTALSEAIADSLRSELEARTSV